MADLYVCRIVWEDGTTEETRPLPRIDAERHVDGLRTFENAERHGDLVEYTLTPSPQIPLFAL